MSKKTNDGLYMQHPVKYIQTIKGKRFLSKLGVEGYGLLWLIREHLFNEHPNSISIEDIGYLGDEWAIETVFLADIVEYLIDTGELIKIDESYKSTFVDSQWDNITGSKVSGSYGGQKAQNSQPTFEAFSNCLTEGHIYNEQVEEAWGDLTIEQQRWAIAKAKNSSKITNGLSFLSEIKMRGVG